MTGFRRALVFGTLTVGTLDILDAITFFGVRNDVPPARIFQSIAAGLLGKASFTGGMPTAVLGLALHYFIAFSIVAVYLLVSGRVGTLRERPFVFGPLYGLAVYVVMNYVVIPLSAAGGSGRTAMIVLINGLLIHALGIGLPTALFAQRATSGADRP